MRKKSVFLLVCFILLYGCKHPINFTNEHRKVSILDIVDVKVINYGIGGEPFSIAVSPDGELIAAYISRGIYIYDSTTLEEMVFIEINLRDSDSLLLSIVFSPDGKYVVFSDGADIHRLNVSTQKIEENIAPVTEALIVSDIGISWDNNYVAFGFSEKNIPVMCPEFSGEKFTVYNVQENKKIYESALACTQGIRGNSYFSFTEDNKVYFFFRFPTASPYGMDIIDIENEQIVEKVEYDSGLSPRYFDVSSDGKLLATLYFNITEKHDYYPYIVQVLDSQTRKVLEETDAYLSRLEWWPDTTHSKALSETNCDNLNKDNQFLEIMYYGEMSVFLVFDKRNLPTLEKWNMATCEKVKSISFH